jgi:hypothetical protein
MTDRVTEALARFAVECAARDHAWCAGEDGCAEALAEHRATVATDAMAASFDVSKELLVYGGAWPDQTWSTTALLKLVETEAVEPPYRDPRRRILRVTTALARLGERGLPPDAVIRTCLGPTLIRQIIIHVASVWVLAREGRLPREKLGMLEAWLAALDGEPALGGVDEPTLPDAVAAAINGETARVAQRWLRSASMAHILGWRLDGYVETDLHEADLTLPAGAGATSWVVDRFTETYLDQWSRESLDWELVYLQDPRATAERVGVPLPLLEERPLTQRQVVDALSRRLSGAVGNDPVAQGLRTEEIVHAIVGLVRGDQLDAAHELAARAARNAPDNPHLCNVLAFCLIPTDRPSAHRALDRLDGVRDPRAQGTAAMNRATLFLADGDADQAEQAMAAVPDDGQIWCWDPVAMVRGEALLLGTTYADWRARASVALEQLRSRSAG